MSYIIEVNGHEIIMDTVDDVLEITNVLEPPADDDSDGEPVDPDASAASTTALTKALTASNGQSKLLLKGFERLADESPRSLTTQRKAVLAVYLIIEAGDEGISSATLQKRLNMTTPQSMIGLWHVIKKAVGKIAYLRAFEVAKKQRDGEKFVMYYATTSTEATLAKLQKKLSA